MVIKERDYKMRTSLLVLLALVLVVSFISGNEVPVIGFEGTSITLKCPLSVDDTSVIEWLDFVWNSDANHLIIFSSLENPDFQVAQSHPHKDNYRVGRDFSLTISDLNMDDDPGEYTCRSRTDGTELKIHYYLTVGETPLCADESGVLNLNVSENAVLECESAYSGQRPMLEWLRNGEPVESLDRYDIRLARKSVDFKAKPSDDGSLYTCRMTFADVVKECHVAVNVLYSVQDLEFIPNKERFQEGDEVRCSAKGNPTPVISLTPDLSSPMSGNGWKSFTIDKSMEGKLLTVHCTASNTVNGITETKSKNSTFLVKAMPVCSGKTVLKPREKTTLTCQMRYYNRQPTIRWLHNGVLVEGTSGQDSGLSSHSLEVWATQNKDGSIYKCIAELDGITDECSLTLDVLYLERELTFTPDKETFEVGDELRCSARGNPTPEVTLAGSGISLASPSNEGSAAVTIDEGWEGRWLTIQCSASNTIEGLEEIIVKNITFHVHDPNHHHHHQHEHHHHQHQTTESTASEDVELVVENGVEESTIEEEVRVENSENQQALPPAQPADTEEEEFDIKEEEAVPELEGVYTDEEEADTDDGGTDTDGGETGTDGGETGTDGGETGTEEEQTLSPVAPEMGVVDLIPVEAIELPPADVASHPTTAPEITSAIATTASEAPTTRKSTLLITLSTIVTKKVPTFRSKHVLDKEQENAVEPDIVKSDDSALGVAQSENGTASELLEDSHQNSTKMNELGEETFPEQGESMSGEAEISDTVETVEMRKDDYVHANTADAAQARSVVAHNEISSGHQTSCRAVHLVVGYIFSVLYTLSFCN